MGGLARGLVFFCLGLVLGSIVGLFVTTYIIQPAKQPLECVKTLPVEVKVSNDDKYAIEIRTNCYIRDFIPYLGENRYLLIVDTDKPPNGSYKVKFVPIFKEYIIDIVDCHENQTMCRKVCSVRETFPIPANLPKVNVTFNRTNVTLFVGKHGNSPWNSGVIEMNISGRAIVSVDLPEALENDYFDVLMQSTDGEYSLFNGWYYNIFAGKGHYQIKFIVWKSPPGTFPSNMTYTTYIVVNGVKYPINIRLVAS